MILKPIQLIDQLLAEGGAIVSSEQCSHIEIADAQATGRWAVDDDGMGYVRRYPEWLALQKTRHDIFARCLRLLSQSRPTVREEGSREDWFDCAITEVLREARAAGVDFEPSPAEEKYNARISEPPEGGNDVR